MRPPICYVCDKEFDTEEGELIYFKKSAKDFEWEKEMKKKNWTGHPPYAEWFCDEHVKEWKELKHLTFSEAKKKIKG